MPSPTSGTMRVGSKGSNDVGLRQDSKTTINAGKVLQNQEEEVYVLDASPFKEDLVEFTAIAVVRDTFMLANGFGSTQLRVGRIVFSVGLLYMNVFVQVFLLFQVKWFISAAAVHDIREAYSDYQEHMYPTGHTHMTVNGKVRGDPGFFAAENFQDLDEDLKEQICQFPLSQPYFLMCILFIWALTCFAEVNNVFDLFHKLIWSLPTIDSTSDSVHILAEDLQTGQTEDVVKRLRSRSFATSEDSDDGYQNADNGPNMRHVVGLTICIKASICIFILLPQMAIATFLLWLGSRWLTATSDFTDLLLNAVALEFIFQLKDLFFRTIISDRNKLDIENTSVNVPDHERRQRMASWASMFYTFLWIPLGLLWCWVYTNYLQRVLPEYNWDVHEMCTEWVGERFEV